MKPEMSVEKPVRESKAANEAKSKRIRAVKGIKVQQ
ncbi:hypothetical protein AJ85_06835 [Alkalihalobacillus alcalophilus ATCC 27647 = CGMCC 1.3604]|uniref:Uncharacterized protein n=1 Tax=Alkalihalobacillus alcalophilus ATCC 27647 = CGMCC 1.3604 TaxID=1218173 RepID=A0A4S4JVU6_ALKAL|nr:hypothetical protein AJ85_06835 [Alkalihalobacillus alcalophilus ATCC 27647 = CGMCC 1.3604]